MTQLALTIKIKMIKIKVTIVGKMASFHLEANEAAVDQVTMHALNKLSSTCKEYGQFFMAWAKNLQEGKEKSSKLPTYVPNSAPSEVCNILDIVFDGDGMLTPIQAMHLIYFFFEDSKEAFAMAVKLGLKDRNNTVTEASETVISGKTIKTNTGKKLKEMCNPNKNGTV